MIPPAYVHGAVGAVRRASRNARLLLLVLESGHAFLVRAREALERGDFGDFVADVGRLRQVVVEAESLLDGRSDPVVGPCLARLSGLVAGDLAFATAAGTRERLDQLRDAWAPLVEVCRRTAEDAAPDG